MIITIPFEIHCFSGSTVHVQLWMWRSCVSFFLIVILIGQRTNALWQLLFLRPIQAGPELLTPNDYWLPGEVVPVDYVLKLVVHMGNLTTRGEVRVEVEVVLCLPSLHSSAVLRAWERWTRTPGHRPLNKHADINSAACCGHSFLVLIKQIDRDRPKL